MKHTKSGVLITFFIIVIGALLIGGATVALFTSTAENTLNSFQSGILEIQLDRDPGNYYFELSNIAPGDKGNQMIIISNTGSLDLAYQLSYTLTGSLVEGSHPLEIQFRNSDEAIIDLALEQNLNRGQKEILTITWELPLDAGNEYQSGTARFDLLVNASQVTQQTGPGSSHYVFRDLSVSDFQTIGPWSAIETGFQTPITHGNLESILFIPNNHDSYTLVSNAVLGHGVYNTGTSGGYGILFETSIDDNGNDTGYILQFDRGFLQIHLRQRINGMERRPMVVLSHTEINMIPTDKNDPWWTEKHRIEIQVNPSGTDSTLKKVSVRIDGIQIFKNIEIAGVDSTENHTGLRTWYSTATYYDFYIN